VLAQFCSRFRFGKRVRDALVTGIDILVHWLAKSVFELVFLLPYVLRGDLQGYFDGVSDARSRFIDGVHSRACMMIKIVTAKLLQVH
jgi:hypothetical protein